MKKANLLATLSLMTAINICSYAQVSNRPSPPAQVEAKIDGLTILINYSRPSKNDREIFGAIVEYGQVWRTGANETTWIDFSEDVLVNGNALAKGRYALFTIPGEDQWTIIFNSKWQDWGAFAYDGSQDVLRVQSIPLATSVTEQFTMSVTSKGEVRMAWDDTEVTFKVVKAARE